MHDDNAPDRLSRHAIGKAGESTAARLGRAVMSLAGSLAMQIAATAAVTLAVATVPWLHESAPAPAAPAPVTTAAGSPAPGALELAGLAPSAAFPMEHDARFSVALHRTYQIVADATWSDGTPVEIGPQAVPSRQAKRRSVGQGLIGETIPTVAVLPPERPSDLALVARADTAGPALTPDAHRDRMAGSIAGLSWPDLASVPLPALPFVSDVSREIDARVAEAREAVTRTATWAAGGVGTIMPRY